MDNVVLKKKKLLLHACCAPCSAYPISFLSNEFDLLIYFSNSNLDSEEEFNKRLENFKKLDFKFDIAVDNYDPSEWDILCDPFKSEPEKGKRCEICIRYRLERSFLFAKNSNIGILTSTLTVSPYKNAAMIFKTAESLNVATSEESKTGIVYQNFDFKKNDGFNKTMQISRSFNLYIQNYCGCKYSKNTRSIKA